MMFNYLMFKDDLLIYLHSSASCFPERGGGVTKYFSFCCNVQTSEIIKDDFFSANRVPSGTRVINTDMLLLLSSESVLNNTHVVHVFSRLHAVFWTVGLLPLQPPWRSLQDEEHDAPGRKSLRRGLQTVCRYCVVSYYTCRSCRNTGSLWINTP